MKYSKLKLLQLLQNVPRQGWTWQKIKDLVDSLWRDESNTSLSDIVPLTIDSTTVNAATETDHTHKLGIIDIANVLKVGGCGALYNFHSVIDSRKITSSDSWVLPDYDGWELTPTSILSSLISFLGGEDFAGKLKEKGILSWGSSDEDVTNEFGFNARGVGLRWFSGDFISFRTSTLIWTSTYFGIGECYLFYLMHDTQNIGIIDHDAVIGASVRLCNPSTLLSEGEQGTYTGNNGIIYNTKVINGIEWLTENLKETKYRNGDWITGYDGGVYTPISNAAWATLTTEAMCFYDDNEAYATGIPLEALLHPMVTIHPDTEGEVQIGGQQKLLINTQPIPDTGVQVSIDFIDADELVFVYTCPVALVFTSQDSEGADATISPALNTNMAKYGKVTVTAPGVGLIVLNGNTL